MESVTKWSNHWFKGPLRYWKPPDKNSKQVKPPKYSNNPSGLINLTCKWTPEEEKFFINMGIDDTLEQEVHLTVFLSYWLCIFGIPSKKDSFIHLGTFKIASRMSRGDVFSLVVLILASIYNGLI